MEGQMWPEERHFLYSAVLECDPAIALEVGTWKGGGSTFQIATALKHLSKLRIICNETTNTPDVINKNEMRAIASIKNGILHTCEVNEDFFAEAVAGFSNSSLSKHIIFYNSPSTTIIKQLITTKQIPQFVFFDGPEDPELNLNDFKLLDNHLQVGAYFCMHDWDLGIRADGLSSTKAELLRPYLEQLSTWKILRTLTAPASVGIVLAKKIA